MKKEILEKNSKIESLNDKISELLQQNQKYERYIYAIVLVYIMINVKQYGRHLLHSFMYCLLD